MPVKNASSTASIYRIPGILSQSNDKALGEMLSLYYKYRVFQIGSLEPEPLATPVPPPHSCCRYSNGRLTPTWR